MSQEDPRPVRLVDLDVPMGDLLWFMIKVTVASLPILLALGVAYSTCSHLAGR